MKVSVVRIELDKLKDGIWLAARGGGIRSCVSIGVLKALEEAKIPVKGVCGESLSSIFAALLATGHNSEEIIDLFLKYNSIITKASKLYRGRGSIVIEEEVNKETNGILMKDLPMPCYINACTGNILKPQLVLFSNYDSPNHTLGEACRASASLPILFGECKQVINGKEINLFDGGFKENPHIPSTDLPVVFASFYNSKDYHDAVPIIRRTLDNSYQVSDVIINAPVYTIFITGSNEDMLRAYYSGYEEAKRTLNL